MRGDEEVLAHREVVEELDRLPRARQPAPRPRVRRQRGELLAVELHATAGADEAADRVDEGRLAGAVRADQADELARADLEVDVDDGVHAAEAHRDPRRPQDRRHGRVAALRGRRAGADARYSLGVQPYAARNRRLKCCGPGRPQRLAIARIVRWLSAGSSRSRRQRSRRAVRIHWQTLVPSPSNSLCR